jgi:Barstar (barnase inhibitor)
MPEQRAFALINVVAATDLDRLVAALADEGYVAIVLDGSNITDKASLLAQADIDLPRPDDLHPHNWDALADTLWNGLVDAAADQLAIVWTGAHHLARSDLQDFLTAVDILARTARDVPKAVLIFLVGDGPEFRRF